MLNEDKFLWNDIDLKASDPSPANSHSALSDYMSNYMPGISFLLGCLR